MEPYYHPSAAGRQDGLNYGRWKVSLVSQDEKAKTSRIKIELQGYEQYQGAKYNIYGQIYCNDALVKDFTAGGDSHYFDRHGAWETMWYTEITVDHERNGEGKAVFRSPNVYARYTYSGGYRYIHPSSDGDVFTVNLPKIDVAAPAYIGGVEHEIYIGSGTAFERYEPLIADGHEFK